VLEEVGRAEVVGHLLVEAGDDFVDGLLPRRLGVFARLDGFEKLPHGLRHDVHERRRNLDVVVAVVVEVEDAEELRVGRNVDVLGVEEAFAEQLPAVLFHLDVIEFPEVGEPLDELSGVVLVELDVGEEGLEDGGGRVAAPEEHQLGLAQMHRRQRRRLPATADAADADVVDAVRRLRVPVGVHHGLVVTSLLLLLLLLLLVVVVGVTSRGNQPASTAAM